MDALKQAVSTESHICITYPLDGNGERVMLLSAQDEAVFERCKQIPGATLHLVPSEMAPPEDLMQ